MYNPLKDAIRRLVSENERLRATVIKLRKENEGLREEKENNA